MSRNQWLQKIETCLSRVQSSPNDQLTANELALLSEVGADPVTVVEFVFGDAYPT